MVRGRARTVRRHRTVDALEAAIDRAVDAGEAHLVRRLCFVRNCYAGETATEAARRVGVSAATGSRWLDRWNDAGVEGLRDRRGRGRPRKLDQPARARLREIVDAEGPLPTAALRDRLEAEFDVTYATEYLPRLLRAIGLTPARRDGDTATPGRPPLHWTVPDSEHEMG